MKAPVKGFKLFNRINENDENMTDNFRMFGKGETSQLKLVSELKELIDMISRSNPSSQEEYDIIKEEIRDKGDTLKSHPNFEEFKEVGFEWQDSIIKLSDWQSELRDAVLNLHNKVSKKGIV